MYIVEFVISPERSYEDEMIKAVKKELDFFLIEKGEENMLSIIAGQSQIYIRMSTGHFFQKSIKCNLH